MPSWEPQTVTQILGMALGYRLACAQERARMREFVRTETLRRQLKARLRSQAPSHLLPLPRAHRV